LLLLDEAAGIPTCLRLASSRGDELRQSFRCLAREFLGIKRLHWKPHPIHQVSQRHWLKHLARALLLLMFLDGAT
jgi:hypothetical protein